MAELARCALAAERRVLYLLHVGWHDYPTALPPQADRFGLGIDAFLDPPRFHITFAQFVRGVRARRRATETKLPGMQPSTLRQRYSLA